MKIFQKYFGWKYFKIFWLKLFLKNWLRIFQKYFSWKYFGWKYFKNILASFQKIVCRQFSKIVCCRQLFVIVIVIVVVIVYFQNVYTTGLWQLGPPLEFCQVSAKLIIPPSRIEIFRLQTNILTLSCHQILVCVYI